MSTTDSGKGWNATAKMTSTTGGLSYSGSMLPGVPIAFGTGVVLPLDLLLPYRDCS